MALQKEGLTTLVQYKHWRSRQVGVKIVRELLGVVTSERADAGIVVASVNHDPGFRPVPAVKLVWCCTWLDEEPTQTPNFLDVPDSLVAAELANLSDTDPKGPLRCEHRTV